MTGLRAGSASARRKAKRLSAELAARVRVGARGGLTSAWRSAAAGAERPNVYVIVIDSLRADRIGYVNPRSVPTPNIDRLAQQSVRFTKAIAPAPWTKPTVSSLLTGLYPTVHGALLRGSVGARVTRASRVPSSDVMRQGVHTLAECLAAEGYTTAAFTGGGFTHRVYQGRGFQHFESSAYRMSALCQLCACWLFSRPPAPLFIWLHAYDTHRPYRGHIPLARHLRRRPLNLTNADVLAVNSGRIALTRSQQSRLSRLYDAGVQSVDRQLGTLVRAMSLSGALDHSILVLLSDHGEALYEHRLVEHADVVYNEVLRVPLLVRVPGVEPRTVDQYVRLIDLMPTLLELVGIGGPRVQGVSLLPAIRDGDDLHLEAFSELETAGRARAVQATVDGRDYKLIRWKDAGDGALFDLTSDPGEQHDLWGQARPEEAHLLSRLEGQLRENDSWAARLENTCAGGEDVGGAKSEVEQRLKDLGYLD